MRDLQSDFWDRKHQANRKNLLMKPDLLGKDFCGLFERLELATDETVFELGCGDSIFLEYLTRTYQIVPFGIDFSDKGLELVCKRLPEYSSHFHKADVHRYVSGGEQYDLVTSYGFIEHFQDRQPIWNLSYSLVKSGGRCLCVAPNLSGINWMFARYFTDALTWHYRVALDGLRREAESVGFTPTDEGYFGRFRLFATPRRPHLRLLKKAINGILYIPSAIMPASYYIAAPFLYLLCKKY